MSTASSPPLTPFQSATATTPALLSLQTSSVADFRSKLPSPPSVPSPAPPCLVLCVPRPHLSSESTEFPRVTPHGPSVYVHKAKSTAGLVDPSGQIVTKEYKLHFSFSADSDLASLYEAAVEPLVAKAKAGEDVTCISYGQTGSGKTYSSTRLVARAVGEIVGEVESVSAFELRGDKVEDLLNARNKLKVLCDEGGRDVVVGLEVVDVVNDTGGKVEELIERAKRLRSTAATRANPQSSRSHCFTILRLKGGGGQMTFVDLAGSESKEDLLGHCDLAEDGAQAEERIKEMKEINSSLGDLKECIRLNLAKAASKNSKQHVHVPYRRSALTRLLRPALDPKLNGDSVDNDSIPSSHKTSFLAHCAPGGAEQLRGTVNTLGYAEFMVRASRADEERKKFKGPEAWSSRQVQEWVRGLEGDGSKADKTMYFKLSEVFKLTGKQLVIMWKGDVDKRVIAAGGKEVHAEHIYNTFRNMVAEAKRKSRVKAGVRRKLPSGKAFGGAQNGGIAKIAYGSGLSGDCVENSDNNNTKKE